MDDNSAARGKPLPTVSVSSFESSRGTAAKFSDIQKAVVAAAKGNTSFFDAKFPRWDADRGHPSSTKDTMLEPSRSRSDSQHSPEHSRPDPNTNTSSSLTESASHNSGNSQSNSLLPQSRSRIARPASKKGKPRTHMKLNPQIVPTAARDLRTGLRRASPSSPKMKATKPRAGTQPSMPRRKRFIQAKPRPMIFSLR